MPSELPDYVNQFLIAGFETSLNSGMDLPSILNKILEAHVDEQYTMTMASWDYWIALHVNDPRFTKDTLDALQNRINQVLGE